MRYRKHTQKTDYDKDDYENDYQYWNLQQYRKIVREQAATGGVGTPLDK